MIELYFVVYNETTGEIVNSGSAPANMMDIQAWEPGTKVLAVDSGEYRAETHYVVADEVIPRLVLGATPSALSIPADGVTESVLSGLPPGTAVRIKETDSRKLFTKFTVDDGALEFSTDEAGDYHVLLTVFPYLEEEHTIVAV